VIGVIGIGRAVGHYVIRELLDAGESVTLLYRDPDRGAHGFGDSIQVDRCDLTGPNVDLPLLDCIVSLAPIQAVRDEIALSERAGGDRVIFFSSALRHSRAGLTDVEARVAGLKAVESSDFEWTILRPTTIYGPGDRNVSSLRDRITKHRILSTVGSGERFVQPVFAGDVAYVVSASVSRESAKCRSFDLGEPEPTTYTNMVEKIADAVGRTPLKVYVPVSVALGISRVLRRLKPNSALTADRIQRTSEDRHVDIDEAREALGFHPRPLDEGRGRLVVDA